MDTSPVTTRVSKKAGQAEALGVQKWPFVQAHKCDLNSSAALQAVAGFESGSGYALWMEAGPSAERRLCFLSRLA